jgi:phosphoglycerate kinase
MRKAQMARVITMDEVRLGGKTVLLRVDINSPLHPNTKAFLDDTRIRAILPTMRKLAKSKTVIMTHQSRPGKGDFTGTLGHARELGRLLGKAVKWVDDIHGDKALAAIEEMQVGDILMLNNIRMDAQELSMKDNTFESLLDSQIVTRLSSVVDVFINDAFACAHRNSPSITGFTHAIPCVAGELMNKEIRALQKASEQPERPCIAILGGIKVDDSVGVADNMLRTGITDQVWVIGGVANLFLMCNGVDIGSPSESFLRNELGDNWDETVENIEALLRDYPEQIIMPEDLAANIGGNRVDTPISALPVEASLIDLGVMSTLKMSKAIKEAGTVILNGPAGVFEMDDFAFGTIEMLNACSESSAYTIMGGGHTATLVAQMGIAEKMGHVSTGGGACLNFLAGRSMPALAGLAQSALQFDVEIVMHEVQES